MFDKRVKLHQSLFNHQLAFLLALFLFATITVFSSRTHASNTDAFAIISFNSAFKPLSKGKARMLYRGKVKRLQGKPIEISDWPNDTLARDRFYELLLSKDQAQMSAYWASLSFSGKARPPREISADSADALILWLAQKDSRIGYLPIADVPEQANVLYIVRKEDVSE